MDPILTTVVATLLGKCTIAYITETVFGGWIANRGDNAISKQIPNISKRILAQFKDTEKPVNHHLQKAILSSHWLATKIFAEDFKKKSTSPLFQRIIILADEQLNQLKKEDYQLKTVSPDAYEADLLIFKDNESNITEILRNKVIDYHVEILFELLRVKADHPEYIVFRNAVINGLPNENLDWFELACSFLNELLKGDNNKAKDAFQNQELAKIAFGIDGLKQELMQGFETLANTYVQGIGEERFAGFVNWLAEEIKEMKGSLSRIETDVKEIKQDSKEIKIDIKETKEITKKGISIFSEVHKAISEANNEISEIKHLLKKKEINLNNYADYKELLLEIEKFDIDIQNKENEKKDLIDIFKGETDEKKLKYFNKDIVRINQELVNINSEKQSILKKSNEFKKIIEITWLNLIEQSPPNSNRLMTAKELFQKGDLKGADEILDESTLKEEYALLQKTSEYVIKRNEILAREFIIKANLIFVQKLKDNWFEISESFYIKANHLNENYENCFVYAYFLQKNERFVDAILWYEKAQVLTKNGYEKAEILNNLGVIHRDINEIATAERYFEEALQIRRKLACNSQSLLPEMGMTLNNIGNLQRSQNEFVNALSSYEEALAIYRDLGRVDLQTYLPDVAMTLNNLAVLQSDQNDFERATSSYQEALAICKELASANPQIHLPDVAMTLNNIGNLQRSQNKFIEALSSYEEALITYRELTKLNSQTYLPELATTLNNLAVLQSDQNDFERASSSYQEALSIRRELARVNPQTYIPDVATTLTNLATLQRAQNDFENASFSYLEALDIRRELARVNPQMYLLDVATTLNNLGNLQSDKNDFENALASYQEALNIYRELARVNPNAFQIDLAEILINLAIFHLYSVKDKDKSLGLSYDALMNALPYQQVPKALQICQVANKVWQAWEEDLMKYLEENQGEKNE